MSHKGFVILQIAEEGPAKEATPQVVEESPVPEQPVATAARPRRAAAAAAQRAIAATAVKRQRGKRLSGASLASLPGDDQMLLVAVANQRKIVCISLCCSIGRILPPAVLHASPAKDTRLYAQGGPCTD